MYKRLKKRNNNYESLASSQVTRDQCDHFLFAVGGNDITTATELIYNGINGDTLIYENKSAISICIAAQQFELAKLLLVREGWTLQNIEQGDYLLHVAVEAKDLELVDLLIMKNINIAATDELMGQTALHVACRLNLLDIAKCLIRNSSELVVNICDKWMCTALLYACRFSSPQTVDFLLKKGALVNIADLYGATPLIHCIRRSDSSSVEILQSLLQAGANTNCLIAQYDGPLMTILHELYFCWCAHIAGVLMDEFLPRNEKEKILQKMAVLLIDYKCNVNIKNFFSQNALHYAVYRNDKVVFDKLLNAGCDIDIFDRDGCSPLKYAFRHMNWYFVRVLINCGANLKLYNWKILHKAYPWAKNLIDYAKEKSIQPKSLQAFCRLTIRNQLAKPIDKNAHCLFLPQRLMTYIIQLKEE